MHRQKMLVFRKGGPALRSQQGQGGFTLVELLVVISIIALLMAILLPALSRARTQAKRIVCLSGLKQLTLAWLSYGDSNNDKLVNGAPETPKTGLGACPDCPAGDICAAVAPNPTNNNIDTDHNYELPWIGQYNIATASDCGKKCAIESGALWRYIRNDKLYHCPTGMKGETITYSIVDGANGRRDGRAASVVPAGPWKKNLSQIKKSATQVVFVDEGRITADSFAVTYDTGGWSTPGDWFDGPDARHGNGTTVSMADGHSEYWLWAAMETVARAQQVEAGTATGKFPKDTTPQPPDGAFQDLYKMTLGCWGVLNSSIIVSGHPSKVQ